MNCIVAQSELAKALKKATKTVSARPSHPILACVRVTADVDRGLTVEANNLEVYIEKIVSCQVEKEGSICIPAKSLCDLVAKLDGGDALDLSTTQHRLCIGTKAGEFSISGFPSEDWVEMPTETTSKFHAVDLESACKTVQDAIAKDRPDLDGVNIRCDGNSIDFAATDGHRLHVIKQLVQDSASSDGDLDDFNITIPESVLKLAQGDAGETQLSFSDTHVCVRTQLTSLTGRRKSATYPDYPQLIPKKATNTCEVDRQLLLRVVDRVGAVAADANNIMFLGKTLERKNNLVLTAKHSQGFAKEFVPAEFQVGTNEGQSSLEDSFGLYLNSRFLSEALSSLQGELVRLEYVSKHAPFLVRTDNQICMIMPLQGRSDD